MIETKRCSACGRRRPLEDFTKDKNRRDGRYPQCKTCRAIWFKNNRESLRQKNRDYRENNPERMLWLHAKKRAARKGIPFAIAPTDIEIPDLCPVLGIPMRISDGLFGQDSPTLDRIDTRRGYEPGNVAVMSFRANLIKNNATTEELAMVLDWMRARSL